MKTIIFCCTLLLIVLSTFSQNNPATGGLLKEQYLKKNKTNKVIGWIIMGTGITAVTVGLVTHNVKNTTPIGGYPLQGEYQNDFSNSCLLTGGIAMAASVPFFIWATKNKKKAASIAFHKLDAILPEGKMLVLKKYPAVCLIFLL